MAEKASEPTVEVTHSAPEDEGVVPADVETEHKDEGHSYSPAREVAKSVGALLATTAVVATTLAVLFREKSRHSSRFCEMQYGCGDQPSLCEECGDADAMWILPLFGDWEHTWPRELRAALYLLGLFWCFLGVNMVCDLFMASIEEITSARRVVWVDGKGGARHKFHVKVWNDTLANLTLMALGSSAPEIMVSTMEMGGRKWFTGELGPSTIVGSAAFNLLLITAVCITAIPAPETRMIKQLDVFVVTAVVSILAYLWLLVVLKWNSPHKVDLEEALITLGMFPTLLVVAFVVDKGCHRRLLAPLSHKKEATDNQIEDAQKTATQLYGKAISQGTIKMMIEEGATTFKSDSLLVAERSSSRAMYRKSVTSNMTGNRSSSQGRMPTMSGKCTIGFRDAKHAVLECAGQYVLPVVLSKPVGVPLEISYATSDGEAKDGVRYTAVRGELLFAPMEVEKTIAIPIIDNNVWEPPESFYVDLYGVKFSEPQVGTVSLGLGTSSQGSFSQRAAGKPRALPSLGTSRATVLVLNDDEAGTLSFSAEEVIVGPDTTSLVLTVNRTNGSCGNIVVNYSTKDGSAIQGFDYEAAEGTIEMLEGELNATIALNILQCAPHPEERHFFVHLTSPTAGVLFDPETNGGDESAICDVAVAGSPGKLDQMRSFCGSTFNKRRLLLGLGLWRDEFAAAFCCGGSFEDQQNSSLSDWVFHCVSLFWKVACALMPPTVFCGGWLCFLVALMIIAAVTVVVIDLANLLGCVLNIPNEVTAITLVALGTSLPDTFASRLAAQNDDCADNAIGNVTGSNCVNVFLGLGLPWTIGTFYWQSEGASAEWLSRCYSGSTYAEQFLDLYPSGGLILPAGSLYQSVFIFTGCALVCVALLMARRYYCGGELGGSRTAQYTHSSLLIALWLGYIGASIVLSVNPSS